jgi:Asp-tRNA(Asn)/Glu-tRNA(Gln) amidotransferase A subunit family amidase
VLADFRDHSLTALAGFVRDGRLSAEEMTAFALERIETLNGPLNAWAALDGDRALRDARALDARIAAGEDPGPLAGIPLAVKDMEDAAGFRTGYGSALHADDPPAGQDSVQVARLRAAGCIVLGKTTTPEFGWYGETISPHWGVTSNPWDLERSPGGSSGGSAAALASGMVPLATGSDGGGSIRIPGSLCGLSVIKTTTGTIPLGGPVPPGAGVLAVRGPMTRRIADVAPALAACAGPDATDPFSLPAQAIDWTAVEAGVPQRVVWAPAPGHPVDAEIARVCSATVARLEGAGTEVIVVDEIFRGRPLDDWFTMWTAYRNRGQGHLRGTADWERIDPGLRDQMDYAETRVSTVDEVRAMDGIHLHNLDVERQLARAPLLLMPTVAGQTAVSGGTGAVDGLETMSWTPFTPVFNMTRHPVGTVCAGLTSDGMPVGLQVVGRRYDDLGVMRAIRAIEDLLETDWRPPAQ